MYIPYLRKSHWLKTHAEITSVSAEREENIGKIRSHRVFCRTTSQRSFLFAEPSKIEPMLESLEKRLFLRASHIKNIKDLADLLATFWFFIIAIHPFSDGNRRTAQKIINQVANMYGYEEVNFTVLTRYLFSDFESDYPTLVNIFLFELRKSP